MLLRSAKYFILSLFSLSGLLSCSKYLEESDHMALINEAGALLYLSKVAEAANLLNQVDTTQLDDREKALFLLGKGFCSHLNGANEPASVYVHRAQHALMKHGYDADQAEGFLVNGLILESVEWNVAASKHFQKALDLLRDQADTDAYFYALLGAMRTSRDGAKFIGEANTCLERNRNKEKQASLLTSRAMLSTDPAEKLALYLLAYEYYDEHSPLMSRIGNLTRIATTYQATGEMDSAFAYLDRLKSLIRANGSDVNHLLKYHLLKAQFENSRKNQEAALTSLAYIFEHSPVGSNMAGNAYQLRAAIYYELGDFEAAHTDLQQHTAFVIKANEESLRLRDIQLGHQVRLAFAEKERDRVDTAWFLVSIFILLAGLLAWLAVFYHKKRWATYKCALKDKYKLANLRLTEQIEQNFSLIAKPHALYTKYKLDGEVPKAIDLQEHAFSIFFNIEHPFFREKILKVHPELSASNLKYCEGILANQTVFESSITLGVTPNAVKKARQKLRTLLNIESTALLAAYLNKIDKTPLEKIHPSNVQL